MKNEDAIRLVKEVTGMSLDWDDDHYEALQLAIDALSSEAVDVTHDIPEYCSWSQTYTNMVQGAMYKESAEAVQGEWIDKGNWMGIECSRCKCHNRYVTPFCPQCGAKMKGGAE